MNDRRFIDQLRLGLQQPLPGWEAQGIMVPQRDPKPDMPTSFRESAVLSLIYPFEEMLHLVLMKRSEGGRTHSGQMSFPGGRKEPEDPSLVFTALREAEEELGIPAQEVEVLGNLTQLYIPHSNFLVAPVVGYLDRRPTFRLSEHEVASILEIPLQDLLQLCDWEVYVPISLGKQAKVKSFVVENQVVWGATAMILYELLSIVKQISDSHT